VKALEGGVPLAQVVLFRSLFALPVLLPLLSQAGGWPALRTSNPMGHVWRTMFGLVGMGGAFYGYATMPLATVTALGFTMPLFLTLLAVPLLGERVGWRRGTAVVVGFAGVLVILRPGAVEIGWPVAAAIGSAFLGAAIVLTTKTLARSEGTGTIMFYIGLVTTVIALPVALPGLAWPGWPNMWLLLLAAFCGPLAMMIWINALRLADASVVAPVSYIRLLFAAVFGIVLFDEVPDAWLGLGALLIVGSTLYITRREARLARERAAKGAGAP
jgi:drug/metabolite transporter (DMT)-like permease